MIDTLGLGHYDGTAMPGGVGNFALAGHRQTRGAVLDYIDQLQVGDHIYVRTKDGYYTYTVYEHVIVQPDNIEVIEPVPSKPGQEPTERIMTLTTCHPRYGDTERYIVHARFESWQPNSAGALRKLPKQPRTPPNPRGYNMYGWIFSSSSRTSMGSHYHCYSAYRRDRIRPHGIRVSEFCRVRSVQL